LRGNDASRAGRIRDNAQVREVYFGTGKTFASASQGAAS
jgi:hypothetical protein